MSPGRFERGLSRVEDVLAGVAALALAALAALMVLGVVLRYVFATPLSWSLAFITDYLMTAIFFLALPWTVRTGAHVRIDVVYRSLPETGRRVCALLGALLAPFFVAALAWGGLALTWSAATGGDIPPPGGAELSWPVWTSAVMVPIGALVLLVRLLVALSRTVRDPLVDDGVDELPPEVRGGVPGPGVDHGVDHGVDPGTAHGGVR
ncbi:TRAP transporter small permease [Pseudonocardia sp. KRD291]|uniref:TRAP transporter small permease n=1 Tax=Pseudonocardia sp. KRD291 TaxID=2792007 RepID=UPI001C49E37D|nr:TRAP transporter small permease [Pseudonocardia sp. KRD291]MBW0105542.1 TRAP transporter small permease [Pseudonocardia sp. KRD291]